MLLIFDCDGVILDSMRLHNQVEAEVYRKQGLEIAPEELGRRFSGVPVKAAIKMLEAEHGCILDPALELEMEALKRIVFAESLRVMPGLDVVLEKLKDIPRCVASGTRIDELNHALQLVDLERKFAPHIYSSELVAKGKPFPDLFLYAAEKLGQRPADCLVIEDGVAGVQAGRAAQMRVFGFTGGSHCDSQHAERLRDAGAEAVFSNMLELPALAGLVGA